MKQVDIKDGASANIVQDNIEQLKNLFPEAFTENGVDFDTLRQLLGDLKVLDEGEEKFGLNWHGKKQARNIALTPSYGTLLPYPEESVNFRHTQNLFIEGDNLEVLKILQRSYANKVKMIYIDPPYNTGKDFVYTDKFKDNLDAYLQYTRQVDENGSKFSSNTETGGRKHTNWLNMMYPRLSLARNLLRQDGVIFISIDGNEQSNLKKICDQIFGEENHLVTMHVQVRYPGKTLAEKNDYQKLIEHVLVYQKYNFLPIKEKEEYSLEKFCWQINELTSGRHEEIGGRKVEILLPGQYEIKKIPYSIDGLKETWASGSVLKGNASGKFFEKNLAPRKNIDGISVLYKVHGIGEDGIGYRYFTGPQKETTIRGKFFSGVPSVRREELKSGSSTKEKPILNFYDFAGAFGNCRHEGSVDFRNGKKPIIFLKTLLKQSTNSYDQDIVLDFFAGSASLAHAVMKLNAEDGGKRKFIMVQLPENIDESKQEQRTAFDFCSENNLSHNIAEIGKERIRRVANKIQKENPEYEGDLGFKVFKLARSNIKVWDPDHSDIATSLLHHKKHLIEGRSEQDILYELLLKRGVDLTTPIETKKIAGKNVHSIGFGKIITCLDEQITIGEVKELSTGIIAWQEELKETLGVPTLETHVFFRDSAFHDDIAKTNLTATLSQNGINHVRSL